MSGNECLESGTFDHYIIDMTAEQFRELFDVSPKSIFYKKRIIEHIIDEGSDTLPNLSKYLEVSVPTASKMVSEMVETGLLENHGKLETSGGRHPFLYGLNPDNCYFLGVDFTNDKMNLVLVNFSGEQLREEMDTPFKFENTVECLDSLCAEVNRFIDSGDPKDRARIVSVGINIFGRLNPETGYSYTYFNFSEVPLGKVLSQKIGLNTFIDNDSRAAAFGEYMMNDDEVGKNMLFVNVSWGLGLGIIVDGKPYAGKSGFSGEFGHIHAYENEVLCHCGKKGCLETEASGSALHRKFIDRVLAGGTSSLVDPAENYTREDLEKMISVHDIIEAAVHEDLLCIEIIEEVGQNLGMHIASLINVFNPNTVIIGGILARAGDYLLQPLKGAIRKYSLNMVNHDTKLRTSLLMRYAGVMGACMLARKKAIAQL